MNPFTTSNRVFYNIQQANNTELQIRSVRPQMIPQMQLGSLMSYPMTNQYDGLYGHSYNFKTPTETLKAPIEADAGFFSSYPIPYTILMTNNKPVDVAGTVYLNKDLPVKTQRM